MTLKSTPLERNDLGWVRCSERNPGQSGWYLCCIAKSDGRYMRANDRIHWFYFKSSNRHWETTHKISHWTMLEPPE